MLMESLYGERISDSLLVEMSEHIPDGMILKQIAMQDERVESHIDTLCLEVGQYRIRDIWEELSDSIMWVSGETLRRCTYDILDLERRGMWIALAEHIYEHLHSIWERLECEDLVILEYRHSGMSISDVYETARREY